MITIVVAKSFEKEFRKIKPEDRQSIFTKLEKLSHEDENLDIKKLQPKKLGFYRLRTGKYRIIYEYLDKKTIKLLHVDSRDKIYFQL